MPAGLTGSDSFTYNVSDGIGTPVNGTVTITFASRIWFVENDAAAGGTGRSLDPFDTLAEAEAVQAAGDMVCVLVGDGPLQAKTRASTSSKLPTSRSMERPSDAPQTLAVDGTTISSSTGAGSWSTDRTHLTQIRQTSLRSRRSTENQVLAAAARGFDFQRVTLDESGSDISGGDTTIGSAGAVVSGDGIRMNQVLGGIAFGALNIEMPG